MKDLTISILVYSILSGGILAGEYWGFDFAGNIAMFLAWVLIIMGVLVPFAYDKEKAKPREKQTKIIKLAKKLLFFSTVICFVAVGNQFTAIMLVVGWVFTATTITDDKDAKST